MTKIWLIQQRQQKYFKRWWRLKLKSNHLSKLTAVRVRVSSRNVSAQGENTPLLDQTRPPHWQGQVKRSHYRHHADCLWPKPTGVIDKYAKTDIIDCCCSAICYLSSPKHAGCHNWCMPFDSSNLALLWSYCRRRRRHICSTGICASPPLWVKLLIL